MATSTLGSGTLVLAGTTSGTTTVTATAVAGTTTLTLPAATDTLVGKATTDTLTNKTLTGAVMNGTLGATTPSTVAATTLTTSSTVTHNGGTANGVPYLDGSKVLTTGSALVFDGANLGLGVTPSAWTGAFKVLEIGSKGGALAGASGEMDIFNNAYNNGSNYIYGISSYATQFQMNNLGQFRWYNAPSGTAGNAITFTQAMTLDASGNLALGTTAALSSNYRLTVYGGRSVFASNSDSNSLYIQYNNATAGAFIGSPAANVLSFSDSNGTERARIDSSGNLLVGTTGSLVSSASRIRATTGSGPTLDMQQTGGATIGVGAFWNTATSGDNIFNTFYTEAGGTTRGSITYNRAGGLTVYNTTSDYRAKDISGPVIGSGALIDSTPVYMGKMKDATQERPMFIAHEVPAYAHTGEKDAVDADGKPVYQQMDASALIPVMWAELQDLRKRLATAGI